MYRHILFATDGSELSVKAESECVAFARSIGAKITAIHVIEHYRIRIDQGDTAALGMLRQLENQHDEVARSSADAMLETLRASARASGVECDGLVVVGSEPYKEIVGHAGRLGCDLIMMASHGRRGLDGLLLGSVTVKVLTHCKIPALIVRPG